MTYETLFSFFTASTILAVAPGPDNIFVLTQSMQYGHKYGIAIVFGLITGLLFHTSLVAFGVAQILAASPAFLFAIQLLGITYLLYLAYLSWNSSAIHLTTTKNTQVTLLQLYKRGIVMNITNPKVTLFFLAFLPQFLNPHSTNTLGEIFLLGFLFIISTLLVFTSIAIFSGLIGEQFAKSPLFQNFIHKVSALVFISISIYLLIDIGLSH